MREGTDLLACSSVCQPPRGLVGRDNWCRPTLSYAGSCIIDTLPRGMCGAYPPPPPRGRDQVVHPATLADILVDMQLFSAAPRLLPRSTESIWFSSPTLDEDADLTEMEASLEAQVQHSATQATVIASIAATFRRSFLRSATSTPTCLSWVGRDGQVASPP